MKIVTRLLFSMLATVLFCQACVAKSGVEDYSIKERTNAAKALV